VAPEAILHQVLTPKADSFSAGVIIYFMARGELPFDDPNYDLIGQKTLFDDPLKDC
jgi:hypothetical protein